MNHDEAVSAALQLQHDAGLMMTNLQVLGQFVTSLNRMSSEVMRLTFGQEQYPADAMQDGPLHDGYEVVAADWWPGRSRASADIVLQ